MFMTVTHKDWGVGGGDHVFVQCMCCVLQAMTYLSYVLYPLVLGGAVYSLLYVSHKRSVFS